MIALVLLAGGACVFITALVAFLIYKSRAKTTTASSGAQDSLKDEIPDVLSVVKGEKAADVIASGYFSGVYPGVQVVTSRASLPKTTPAFLLLTDASGTVTGVEANSVLWNSGVNEGTVPPRVTKKPTPAKPGKK